MSPTYPSRRSLRLQDYDYAQAGAYVVTLCTDGRLCRFGSIQDDALCLNPLGRLVAETWAGLEDRFDVGIDAFVVMPNHLHGVLLLPGERAVGIESIGTSEAAPGQRGEGRARQEPAPAIESWRYRDASAGQSRRLTLSEVIRRFKTYTANRARSVGGERGNTLPPLWQRNFHERVIRNERELTAVREYIATNPVRWHLDRENPDQ